MPPEFIPLLIEFGVLGILALLFWLIVFRVIDREKARRKSPFTKELQKSPGEGCLRKMDELNDKFFEWYTIIFLGFGFLIGIAFGAGAVNT